MKKGCLISLSLYLLVAGGAYYFFHTRFTPPGDWIGALVTAMFVTFVIGSIQNAKIAMRERSLLNAQTRGRMPKDGEEIGVCGTIHPVGSPMKSPMTEVECVFYEYDIVRTGVRSSDVQNAPKDFTGFQLAPTVVRGPAGDVKILGYPFREGFPKDVFYDDLTKSRAQAFLAKTEFEKVGLMDAVRMIKEVFADDDGSIIKNYQIGKSKELFDFEIIEEVIPAGAEVTVFGIYSQMKGGITADFHKKGRAVQVYAGGKTSALGRIRGKITTGVVLGFVFAVLSFAPWGVLALREGDMPSGGKTGSLIEAATQGNIPEIERLIKNGMDPNKRVKSGLSPLLVASSPAAIETLVRNGADINQQSREGDTLLIMAARRGDQELVSKLILMGANVNIENNDTPPKNALTTARTNGYTSIVEILRAAGSNDDAVTAANGTPLPPDGGAQFKVVKRYLKAVHEENPSELIQLVHEWAPDYFETVNYPAWKMSRPEQPQLVSGFESGRNATVIVGGTGNTGLEFTWQYQLIKIRNDWKILAEYKLSP